MTQQIRNKHFIPAALASFASALALLTLTTACDVESANSVSRTVEANVAGVYAYDDDACSQGQFITAESSISSFDLRQTGDQLEAITDDGQVLRGTIGNVVEGLVSFTLEGLDPQGNAVIVSGTINIDGSEGVMNATWIEDSVFGTVCGSASGVSTNTNVDPGTNTNLVIRSTTGWSGSEIAEYRNAAQWFREG